MPRTRKTSRYLGVCWDSRRASWRFSIKGRGHVYALADFDDEAEAAVVRDRLALHLHGAKAKINFVRRTLKPASFEALSRERRQERSTSRYRGVTRDRRVARLKWVAHVQRGPRSYFLGRYATERAAALAYDRGALYYLDQRAKLNFPRAATEAADDRTLRAAARAEHKKTTASKYRGVHRHGSGGWSATIGHEYQRHWLGTFATEEEAAEAYDKAARRIHGKAAKLNFPERSRSK